MTRHPAAGLSKRQREAFERIAIGQDKFVHPATAGVLAKHGLIEIKMQTIGADRFGTIEVPRYEVPIHLHMQWCQWCSENVKDDEL